MNRKQAKISKNKKKSKSQEYIPPSPALRFSPLPFYSQETPKNYLVKKAKKRKLNHDLIGENSPTTIDFVALVPSSKIKENKNSNKQKNDNHGRVSFSNNDLPSNRSIVDYIITPSPVANRTRCGEFTSELFAEN